MHGLENMMTSWVGILSLIIFVVAYLVIAMEEKFHINKSKPALFAGTFIFILIGIYQYSLGYHGNALEEEIHHLIFEISLASGLISSSDLPTKTQCQALS